MLRFWKNENAQQGITGGLYRAGVSNIDSGEEIEKDVNIPWVIDPIASWLDYACWIEVHLDSGMVLHKQLPQKVIPVDHLAAGIVSPLDTSFDKNVGSANLVSQGGYTDTIQRMTTSDYRFCLKGYGRRAGYTVPVPGIKTIAGIAATPERQWSLGNMIESNYSGVPIWLNAWRLWYIVALPPKASQLSPPNLAQHIRADTALPDGWQVPISGPDSNAVTAGPQTRPSNIQVTKP